MEGEKQRQGPSSSTSSRKRRSGETVTLRGHQQRVRLAKRRRWNKDERATSSAASTAPDVVEATAKEKQLEEELERERGQYATLLKQHQTVNAELAQLKKSNEDLLTRLSAMASSKLRDGNPNIADLSDENRPTKLGEKMSELYDTEWTDAFDCLQTDQGLTDDKHCIHILLEILFTTYQECRSIAEEQINRILEVGKLLPESKVKETVKTLKDLRKSNTLQFIEDFEGTVDYSVIAGSATGAEEMQTYIRKCSELCWWMLVQDPPVCLQETPPVNGELDTKLYKEYTKRGRYLQYVVWPPLLLYQGGPILAKGVAQGGKERA